MQKRVSADERQKLYDEIWTDPVTVVAQRYGISDVALRKRCKAISIPLPPRGYWERLRAGQSVPRTALPKVTGELKKIVHSYAIKYKADMEELSDAELSSDEELGLFSEETKKFICEKCSKIEVKGQLRDPHHLVIEHKEEMAYRKLRDRRLKQADFSPRYYTSVKSGYRDNKPVLPIHVSDDQMNRVYRILDSLIKTIEDMEGSVSVRINEGKDEASFNIAFSSFDFSVKEETKPIRKPKSGIKTDESTKESVGYLIISLIGECWYDNSTQRLEYKDTAETQLESQLGKIVFDMFVVGSRLYARVHLLHREQQREWKEEERQQRLKEKQQEEQEKVEVLKSIVADWDIAQKIRNFADTLEQKVSKITDTEKKDKMLDWVRWARERADWVDPLTDKEDKLLGEKEDILDIIIKMSGDK